MIIVIIIIIFLITDIEGKTLRHVAVEKCTLEIFLKVWVLVYKETDIGEKNNK